MLYLRFFKVATLYLDDSFAHSWHSFNQLHLECFSNSLEGVLTYAFPLLCGPTPISTGMRSGDLMQHSITLFLGQIAHKQPGGVLGHCSVENK